MTTLEFENSAFSDAIKKANAIAPSKGGRFEEFHGFLFEYDENGMRIRCTDGDIYYKEVLYPIKEEGEHVTWRVSSMALSRMVATLPVRLGAHLTLDNTLQGRIQIKSGTMRATLPLIPHEYFPVWDDFDDADLDVVENFGKTVDMVSWSCEQKNIPPKCGVFMDHEKMVATNNYTLASVPVKMDLGPGRDNIVVPVKLLGPVLRTLEEVKVGVKQGHLLIAPSEDIHIKCALYDDQYPNLDPVLDASYPELIAFSRDEVAEVVGRVKSVGTEDRQIALEIEIGDERMTLAVRSEDTSEEIEEIIYLIDQAEHDPVKFLFSAEYFLNAVQKCPGKQVVMHYNPDKPASKIKCEGPDGYACIVMARRPRKAT